MKGETPQSLYTRQPCLSHKLDAEEKEMKSFETQLSHSLLFPLKPNYFSTRIQHMWADTWKLGELMNPEEWSPAFPVQHPGSTWPLPNSTPMDGKCGRRPSDGKTYFTAEKGNPRNNSDTCLPFINYASRKNH